MLAAPTIAGRAVHKTLAFVAPELVRVQLLLLRQLLLLWLMPVQLAQRWTLGNHAFETQQSCHSSVVPLFGHLTKCACV